MVTITTVHGTFADGATWIEPTSDFCKRLCSELVDVRLIPFRWRSSNSHRARNLAAVELQKQLWNTTREFPTAKHFVVGHSHGGTITLYALRDEGLSRRIAGVVCLSTPFISCASRNLDSAEEFYSNVSFGFGLLAVVVGSFLGFVRTMETSPYANEIFVFLMMCFMALYFVRWVQRLAKKVFIDNYSPVVVFKGPVRWLFRRLSTLQDQYEKKLDSPKSIHCPMLVYHAKKDPVVAYLSTLERFISIPFNLWNGEVFGTLAAILVPGMFVVSLGDFGLSRWRGVEPHFIDGPNDTVLNAVALSGLGAVVYTLVALLVLALVLQLLMVLMPRARSHPLGVGWESPLLTWIMDVRTTLDPVAVKATTDSFESEGFAHSWLHDSPEIASRIARWMSERHA